MKYVFFFKFENQFQLAQKLNDAVWIQQMAHLAHIFTYFNQLKTSLREININIFKVHSKINDSLLKFKFWEDCILKENIKCFPNLHNIFVDSNDTR